MKQRSVNIGFLFKKWDQMVTDCVALPERAVRRRFFAIALIVVFFGMCGFSSASSAAAANSNNPPAQSPAPAPTAPIRLAIGALGGNAEENKDLADLVAARLTSAKSFELVERQELESALREQALSFSGLVRAKDAVRVGHLARADWFLLGSSAKVNGTNTLFLRIVDARSATIRNVGVFSEAEPVSTRAEDVARFVIHAGETANNSLPASYLAIGGFQDTGINNRYTNFPTQIRAYLASAYQGSQVTVLEREAVEPLLQELRMDIAGLTEVSTNHTTPQAAFWLVDGFYQSYETSGPELDLVLRVEQVFGRRYLTPLREQPGDQLLRNAKAAIDVLMAKNDAVTNVPNAKGEIAMQMARGEKLLATPGNDRILFVRQSSGMIGGLQLFDQVKKRQNMEDAKRAFETVLLLDPENREAKMDLATCLRYTPLADLDQARSLFREIIAAGLKDAVTDQARAALAFSYVDEDFKKEAELGQTFATQCTDQYYANLCKYAASSAIDQMHRRHLIPDDPLPDPEIYITSRLQEITDNAKTGPLAANFDFGIFSSVYSEPAVAAEHINHLLPKLEAQFPNLKPYLLYEAAVRQTDKNSAVIKEFLDNLDSCLIHPEKTGNATNYFSHLSCRKAYNMELFEMAARIAEARQQAVRNGWINAPDDPRKVEMAFIFMAADRWKEALGIFESFGNRVVKVGNLSDGPWVTYNGRFAPELAAEECRKHLGIAPPTGCIEFKLGKSLCHAECHFGFVPAGDSVWVAPRNGLWVVDTNGHATKKVSLPTATNGVINCMAGANGKLWIGTGEAGLIEYDISSGTLHQYTEDDGLMMNSILCLLPMEDTLWIGYGNRDYDEVEAYGGFNLPFLPESGGVGRMDLKTHRFTALTPPLRTGDERRTIHFSRSLSLRTQTSSRSPPLTSRPNSVTNGFKPSVMSDAERIKHRADAMRLLHQFLPVEPPRNRVVQLAPGRPGEMWMAIWNTGIESYNIASNSWDILPTPDDLNRWSSLALRDGQIIGGISDATVTPQTANKTGLGMHVYGVGKGDWQHMAFEDELPGNDVTAVALSGSDLWIGGKGFVAVADLNKDKLRGICHFSATVQAIQVQDGYAWIQLPRNLYRVSLQTLN